MGPRKTCPRLFTLCEWRRVGTVRGGFFVFLLCLLDHPPHPPNNNHLFRLIMIYLIYREMLHVCNRKTRIWLTFMVHLRNYFIHTGHLCYFCTPPNAQLRPIPTLLKFTGMSMVLSNWIKNPSNKKVDFVPYIGEIHLNTNLLTILTITSSRTPGMETCHFDKLPPTPSSVQVELTPPAYFSQVYGKSGIPSCCKWQIQRPKIHLPEGDEFGIFTYMKTIKIYHSCRYKYKKINQM